MQQSSRAEYLAQFRGDTMAVPTDIQTAVSALTAKKPHYDMLFSYYDGRAPLIYSSEKLREIFSGLNARFTENWCGVVVDSVLDRLELRDVTAQNDDAATALLQVLREQTGLVDDEYSVHEDVAVVGESFVLAWPDEDGAISAYHNDARLCHAQYAADNPRRMAWAAKWWPADDGVRLTMYYPDRFEYYVTKRGFKQGETPDARSFEPYGEEPQAPNEFGVLPLFHFRASRRGPKSQLANVVPVQDMLNKLLADMMVVGEFAAFPQRYVISQAGIANLQNNPNAIWDLVASDKDAQATTPGQFAAASLDGYLAAINRFSTTIGTISSTPKHFFYGQGGDPSGEALIAMEAPLNRKVERLQGVLEPTWRDLYSFLAMLAGQTLPSQNIWANYEEPETIQPRTTAEIRELSVRAGMPLTTVLRDEGWTDADLAQMDADKEAERVQQASYADAVLSQAQRNFDGGAVA
jgi:hypothetical protein